MAARTKRPQNKCKSCGHTWYPRGTNLSPRCPHCGSADTKKITGFGIGACVLIGLALVGHNSPPKTSDPNAQPGLEQTSTPSPLGASIPDLKHAQPSLVPGASSKVVIDEAASVSSPPSASADEAPRGERPTSSSNENIVADQVGADSSLASAASVEAVSTPSPEDSHPLQISRISAFSHH